MNHLVLFLRTIKTVLIALLLGILMLAVNAGFAQTITLTSQEALWIDANKCTAQGPGGAWLSFVITNNTSSDLTDVVVTFDGFTGTNASYFETPSDPVREFSVLKPGAIVPVYYYVDYSDVCNHPHGGGTTYDGYTANYSVTVSTSEKDNVVRNGTVRTEELLTAQAAGVTISSVVGPGLYVGQILTQTVVYEFGNNTDLFFQPAYEGGFQDDCIRLVGSEITAVSGSVPTSLIGLKDKLHFPEASVPGGGGTISLTFSWEILCLSTSQIVHPWAAAKSGQKYKYTWGGESSTFPPASNPLTISKSVDPDFFQSADSDPGEYGPGIAQWTVTLTNPTNVDIIVDEIHDIIPGCLIISDPIAGSSLVTEANSTSYPGSTSAGLQKWIGLRVEGTATTYNYKVPANGTYTLVYETDIRNCSFDQAASFTNSATAIVGNTIIGPATATISIVCEAPEIICSDNKTIECDEELSFDEPLVSDVADPDPDVIYETVTTPGDCANEYSVTRTWTVTNNCGLTASCSQTIWVEDTKPPVFSSLPDGGSLPCNPENLPTCDDFAVTATDNCDETTTVSCEAGDIVDGEYCLKSQTFTFRAADDCGNEATAGVTYHWLESTDKPYFVNLPEGGDLGCNPESLPECAIDVSVSYVCGGGDYGINCIPGEITENGCLRSQTFTYTAAGLDCYPEFSETVTYTWTDDTEAPTFASCPTEPIDLGCNPETLPNSDMAIAAVGTISDNCDAEVTVTATGGEITGECSKTQVWTVIADADCGPDETCTVTYTWKVDLVPPVITTTTEDTYLGCSPSSTDIGIALGSATALDNCDGNISYRVISQNGPVLAENGCLYFMIRTFDVTDLCGNAAAQKTVKVTWTRDIESPTFASCPTTSIDLGCNPETLPNSAMAIAAAGAISDNCDADVAVTATGGEITGDCTKTQVWTVVADADCGPDATCTVTYTWKVDLVPPVITTTTEDTYLGCSPSSTDIGIALGSATALDNCDGNISYRVISQNGPVLAENGCLYFMIRTFDVTDLCGNAAVQKTVKVTWTRDIEAPTFASCPTTSIDLGCNPETLPDSDMAIAAVGTITDNCDASVTVTATGGEITGDCTKTQVWTVVADADCGPDAECLVTYTWTIDIQVPVFADCPTEAIDLGCNPTTLPSEAMAISDAGSVTDNCDATLAMSAVGGNISGTCIKTQTWIVTAATDCGPDETCSVTYTWKDDTTQPVWDQELPNTEIILECGETLPALDLTASDNCGEVTYTAISNITPGECPVIEMGGRRITATDVCGNSISFAQGFKIVDTTPPVWNQTMPGDLLVECGNVPSFPSGITASDNCDDNVEVYISEDDWVFDICGYEIIRTFTARDDCMNVTTHVQTITVKPAPAPELTIYGIDKFPVTMSCADANYWEELLGSYMYASYTNGQSGNCLISGVVGPTVYEDWTLCKGGTLTFVWKATEVCELSLEYTHVISVLPAPAAILTIPTLPTSISCSEAVAFTSVADATFTNGESGTCENSGLIGAIVSHNWTTCSGGTIEIVWSGVDDCGNSLGESWSIYVFPAPEPDITTPTGLPTSLSCAEAALFTTAPGATYTNGETGECGINGTITALVIPRWDPCRGGDIVIVWEKVVECNYHFEEFHVIQVLPAPAPILTLPLLPTSLSCSEAAAFTSVADATFTNGESGTCENSGLIPAIVRPSWTTCNGGTIEIEWSGTDDCGNLLSKSWTIEVLPSPAPSLSLPAGLPVSLTCAEAAAYTSAPPAIYSNRQTGDCGRNGTISASIYNSWNSCQGGFISVIYEGKDDCGFIMYEVWRIEVGPAPAPTLSVPDLPDNLTCAQADAFIPPVDATYTNVDEGACQISGYIAASVIHDWTLCNGGIITVTYSGNDQCGHLMEYSKTINVEPSLPASFLYLPDDISMSCDEYDTFQPSYLAYSNAGPLKMAVASCLISGEVLGELSGEYDACEGIMHQTWTFTDLCGRNITHVQNIHLYDETPPVIAMVGDVTMEGCNPNWPLEIAVAWTDNCSTGGVVKGVAGDVVNDGCSQYRYYTFNVDDDCGNPAIERKMKLTRKYDVTPPDFVMPADLMVDMSGNCTYNIDPSVTGSPTKITDNCVGDLTINYSDSDPIVGDCAGNLTIERAWRVADACNNATVKRQVISIADNAPPILAGCPKDITICDNETMAEIILPSASDNCDTEVPVDWLRSDGAIGLNDKFEPGETTISFTAADDCGNTASCSMKVTVYRAPDITVEDLTDCSTDEGGITAVFALEDAITSITFPSGTAVFVSSLHGQILSTQEALDNYVGTDGEQITITLTTLDECSASAAFKLHINPRPVLTVQDLTECSTAEGGNQAVFDILSNVSAEGGNLAFVSNLYGPLNLTDMDAYTGTDGEIITVSSTSPPPALCQTIKSFTITVHPRPILKEATATFCEDDYTNFDITAFNDDVLADGQNVGDFDCEWSSSASPNVPTMSNPSAVTEYFVTVTNISTKCSSSAKLTITVNLCSWLNLTKTTNKLIVPELNWTFVLYEGTFGNLTQIASETTQGIIDGVLFREAGPLSRQTMYTVCEQGVPAGYGTTWMIDPELDGVFLIIPYTTSPGTGGVYNPNSVDDPPQDLGNRCYTFDGSMLPINNFGSETPLALQLTVDNTFPGGDARTPGYWKNWNTCTGGGQQYTASENAYELDGLEGTSAYDRVYSGWALLDDIIELFGITWGDFELTTCENAQFILDNRDLGGVNRASDPAYTLAKHLLAYQLNQGAGSYICYEMTDIETEAVDLLVKINFAGIGDYLRKTTPALKVIASRALELAAILDAYNNNEGCDALADMIDSDSDPIDEIPLSCTTTVTNISKKGPGKVVVNAIGGKTPYLYSIDGGATTQTSNVFEIIAAGTYTFTVTDSSDPEQTCSCSAKVTSTVKSASISAIAMPGDKITSELKVYPNPFTSEVYFEFVSGNDVNARLEIFNMLGQKVTTLLDQRVEMGVLNRIEYRPMTHPGILFYRLSLDDEIFNGKLIYNKE